MNPLSASLHIIGDDLLNNGLLEDRGWDWFPTCATEVGSCNRDPPDWLGDERVPWALGKSLGWEAEALGQLHHGEFSNSDSLKSALCFGWTQSARNPVSAAAAASPSMCWFVLFPFKDRFCLIDLLEAHCNLWFDDFYSSTPCLESAGSALGCCAPWLLPGWTSDFFF